MRYDEPRPEDIDESLSPENPEEYEEPEPLAPLEPTEEEVNAILDDDDDNDDDWDDDDDDEIWDSGEFITYILKEGYFIPEDTPRITAGNITYLGYFNEIPWKRMQRGDILVSDEDGHLALYKGDNKIIHAFGGEITTEELNFTGKAYRISKY